MSLNICSANECTGCGLCSNVCTMNAISILPNKNGELHPVVDESKCVNCGLCCRLCPNNSVVVKNKILEVYASYRRDNDKRTNSASGGIAALLGEEIVKQGGVYFGCCFDEELNPMLCGETDSRRLSKFKGSKYVQCYSKQVYKEILNFAQLGTPVIFIALPCQIAALKTFLARDYENVYTVDLLCHGVSSPLYLKEYVDYIKSHKRIETVDNISFRTNIDRCDFRFCLWNEGQLLYRKPAYESLYFSLFLKGISFRESCYNCKYKCINRVGDLTLGDFIGLGRNIEYKDNPTRVSFIAVNNPKGKKLFDSIKNYTISEKRSLDEALACGRSLKESFPKHRNHNYFIKTYEKYGFVRAAVCSNCLGIVISFVLRCFDKTMRLLHLKK